MRKTPAAYAQELHAALVATGREMRPAVIRAFFEALARVRKSGLKPRIFAEFRRVALAAEGRRAGRLVTACALESGLRAKIEKKFGNVVFEEAVDPKIRGGAIVEVEDTRYDGSVRTRLANLKNALANETR